MVVKGLIREPHAYITIVMILHMTDGVTVMSLSASLQHDKCGHISSVPFCIKLKIVMDRLCQLMLNQISRRFGTRCEFSSHVKVKLHKKRTACM